jgi:hypothetical protein
MAESKVDLSEHEWVALMAEPWAVSSAAMKVA